MQAHSAYRQGNLREAIQEISEVLRNRPDAHEERGLLVELLCASGEFDRADRQLLALEKQKPDAAPSVALWRQIVRAAQWREDVFSSGRAPEFLGPPDECLRAQLEAQIYAQSGDAAAAADRLARVEEHRPHCSGLADGTAFDDLRDLDDRLAGCFEILTSTGKYYWLPLNRVRSIEFEPPARPRDLVWRQAEVDVMGGPSGVVYVPVIYPGADQATTEQQLARATDWLGGVGEPSTGLGQRTFLIGDDVRSILEISEIAFDIDESSEASQG